MPFTKSIYRTLLAVLLLAGLFVSGSATSPAHYVLQGLSSIDRAGSEKDQPTTDSQLPEQAFLQTGWHISGNAPGNSGHFAAGKTPCIFPVDVPSLACCSKSMLRRRLNSLQEHFDFPQRLSLFPKHGFW